MGFNFMNNSLNWTREETDFLIRLFNEGKTFHEISERLNSLNEVGSSSFKSRSPKSVALKLVRLGLINKGLVEDWEKKVIQETIEKRKEKRVSTKIKVMKREGRSCVICDEKEDLQMAHIVPFRKTKVNKEIETVILCPKDHDLFDKNNAFEVKKVWDYMKKKYSNYEEKYKLCEKYNPLTNKDDMWVERR